MNILVDENIKPIELATALAYTGFVIMIRDGVAGARASAEGGERGHHVPRDERWLGRGCEGAGAVKSVRH